MMKYFFLASIAATFSIVAQILLKLGSNLKSEKRVFFSMLNIFTASGYIIFIGVTVLNLIAYSKLPLNYSIIFLPYIYIAVIISSVEFFKEKIDYKETLGIILVILGVFIYLI